MRILVCSLILFSCGSEKLHKICPLDCYSGPVDTKNVGACKQGVPVCDKALNILSCKGEITPQSEVCDNRDNDCNGSVDDDIETWEKPCLHMGVCQGSYPDCYFGTEQCNYSSSYEQQETKCDALDNDCDGLVDEDLFSGKYCYSGAAGTEFNYPCHPGAMSCVGGDVVCVNEIVPVVEMCDEIDNDCNGIIDDTGDLLSRKFDIVFNFDTSGSMSAELDAVAVATSQYAEQFIGNVNYRFAIVVMSAEIAAPYVLAKLDFTDFATFQSELAFLQASGSASEASLDSMKMVCAASNPLNLDWTPGANGLIFTFTDESPQTYMNPPTTGQSVVDSCLFTGRLPFIWSRDPFEFEYISVGANAFSFNLSEDWQKMFDDMNSIVISLCGT